MQKVTTASKNKKLRNRADKVKRELKKRQTKTPCPPCEGLHYLSCFRDLLTPMPGPFSEIVYNIWFESNPPTEIKGEFL